MPQEPHIERPINPSASWPSFGNLIFDNVSASYNPDAEKPVWSLHNVGFEIRAGERVAVCGRSGAGKSSLFLSLLGLIKPSQGTITLDGIDISRLPGTLLRSRLCVISQDAFTHGETVREALLPEQNLADDVINDVLRDCSLLDKINISGGLSTKLDTVNLSIGETQLFVLARTILQAGSERGGVVLFDEATSRSVIYVPLTRLTKTNQYK
jgi:ABC-type multidrug transport system fused ATPase/permease subunit